MVKLGFTGVYIIFLCLLKNIDCGYSLEPPRRGGSNEYHNLCLSNSMKNIRILSENFHFFVVKCSIYLKRRVFVMYHLLLPDAILFGLGNGVIVIVFIVFVASL